MLTKREVMIGIKTVRRGLPIPLFAADGYAEDGEFDDEELLEEEPDGNMDPDDLPEEAEMMMEGRLVTTSRRVELVYDEGELTGMEGSTTKIGFDLSCPELVSLLRSGSVSTALIFEPKKRHVCVYNTPFSAFEVCVQTLRVQNELLENGTLYLDYLIEIHGARTERCKMTLTVR